jgi:hypothetical protein
VNDAAQPMSGSTEYCKPARKAQQALDLPPIKSSTSPFNLRREQRQGVRYSSVRRNKPYSSNKKHLPQLQQHVFTGESSKYKCGKSLDIAETAEKKGYEKINSTQMTSISPQRIQQFQQKDKLFIYRHLSIILFVE